MGQCITVVSFGLKGVNYMCLLHLRNFYHSSSNDREINSEGNADPVPFLFLPSLHLFSMNTDSV